jgi:hypothetical protein
MAKDRLRTLVWLLDTIYRSPDGISLKEINSRWKESVYNDEHLNMPRNTFKEHLLAIEDMFDIEIRCFVNDGYKYRILFADDIRKDNVRRWLLNTLTVNNLITDSRDLRRRIQFEDIPTGYEYLDTIIRTMKDGVCVEMTYQGIDKTHPSTYYVEPYFLKVFRRRWYLIGKKQNDETLYTFSLDRVVTLSRSTVPFVYPDDFDAHAYYKNCFGIIRDDTDYDVETIRLKVYDRNFKRKYFRLLPLHPSQREVEKYPDYSIFEYRLYPSFDFFQEILSHGADVEVVAPEWFGKDVADEAKKMVEMYRKEEGE